VAYVDEVFVAEMRNPAVELFSESSRDSKNVEMCVVVLEKE
jgi:hypothetical protein